jgi:hypothetical protein
MPVWVEEIVERGEVGGLEFSPPRLQDSLQRLSSSG